MKKVTNFKFFKKNLSKIFQHLLKDILLNLLLNLVSDLVKDAFFYNPSLDSVTLILILHYTIKIINYRNFNKGNTDNSKR